MVKFLIERPVAVIMSFIAIVVLGLIASYKLPVSLMPDIDIPEITVQVSHANTSVREMENTIITPLRRQLMQISNLEDIYSETRDGSSTIHLKFKYGTDNTISFIDANEKIDVAMRDLPKEVERPRVIKASASDIPVFNINVSLKEKGDDNKFIEVGELCEAVLKRRIEQLSEVALVDVTGLIYSELFILPNSDLIKSLGISQEQIQEVLKNNNVSYGNILVQEGDYRYNIRFSSSLKSVEDVQNIYIKSNDKIFQLKDISEIGLRPRQVKGKYLSNAKEAISLAVIKQSEARIEDLKLEVNKLINSFRNKYPEIELTLSQDQTSILNYTISNLKQSLVLGAFLAFIIMFFFLKDIKSPFLIGFSIPTSLIISLLFFKLVGLSINIISLSGLILGIGMMIDNSIIVIDNIIQYVDRKETILKACIKGTNEVIRPLISSVLTTCAVFIPLLFLSGISGALFYDQAIAVAIGLTVSLLVAITLLPVLYKLFHKKNENGKGKLSRLIKLIKVLNTENTYEKGFVFVFKYKKYAFPLFFSIILISYLFFHLIAKEKLPQVEQKEIIVNIDWNESVTIKENKKRVLEFLEYINDQVETTNTYIGEQQFLLNREKRLGHSESRIYVKVYESNDLSILKQRSTLFFKERFNNARFSLTNYKTLFDRLFSDDQPDIIAKITSKTDEKIPNSKKIEKVQRNIISSSLNLKSNKIVTQSHIVISLDSEKLLLYDVTRSAIFSTLKSQFNVLQVDLLKSNQRYIPIVISDKFNTVDDILNELTILNKNGLDIPVKALVSVNNEQDYKTLFSGKNGQFVPLEIDLGIRKNVSNEHILSELEKIVREDSNLDVAFGGNIFSGGKLIKEMVFVLFISILLLYFILAAQFESLTQPIIVLLELPIDIAGALILLYVFGESLNLMSMIGIVVMSGIIINDSILKIATINQLRKNGCNLVDALQLAGKQRLKPILMTSLTTILALVPFLFYSDLGSELQKPFALAVIGGMILGTLVSLYFIPLCYYFLYSKKAPIQNVNPN